MTTYPITDINQVYLPPTPFDPSLRALGIEEEALEKGYDNTDRYQGQRRKFSEAELGKLLEDRIQHAERRLILLRTLSLLRHSRIQHSNRMLFWQWLFGRNEKRDVDVEPPLTLDPTLADFHVITWRKLTELPDEAIINWLLKNPQLVSQLFEAIEKEKEAKQDD